MNSKITAFVDGLISYDYVLFGASFTLFILFIVLSILLRRKLTLAVVLVLLGFSFLVLGPSLGYIQMHKYLFKNSVTLTSQKELSFSEAIVVKGELVNESRFDFSSCKITASLHQHTENKYKNMLYALKPFQNMSMFTPEILKGQTYNFKLIIEPFRYKNDYNISLGADCK